jgi:predicted Fe-S protein YdhL (DUF1289 family)
VGICTLDDATGYCLGCGRTGDEVAQWITMSDSERDDIWQKLPERLEILGIPVRLLPWTRDEILAWARDTIVTRQGIWTIGAAGIAAEFPSSADREISVTQSDGALYAHAPGASFRLRIDDKVRAFGFAKTGTVVLGLPRRRAALLSSSGIAALGPDTDAIDDLHRQHHLFDLGVGGTASRFCIRTDDEIVAETLSAQAGRQWREIAPLIGQQIRAAKPSRIVKTALARIEMLAPAFSSSDTTDESPSPILPAIPIPNAENTEELTLPPYAVAVAVFYPSASR